MAAQDNLPEGTDHIINGAMETHGAASDDGSRTSGGSSAGQSEGFVATGGGEDRGGTQGITDSWRSQTESFRGQAGERVREFADGGKSRASDTLDEFSKVVADAADSIEQRVGPEYAEYARKAGDAISGFADTLRRKEVDELYDDVRSAVRKSPAVAIGIAAALGFTLVRLVKAGMPDDEDSGGKSRSSGRKTDA